MWLETYNRYGGTRVAERLYRTQILLEPAQHRALVEISRREGRSISDLVREMIQQHLADREQAADAALKRQLRALERLRQHRREILARRGGQPLDLDPVDLIRQMREERDERNLAGFPSPGD